MNIAATIRNGYQENQVTLSTNNNEKNITIPGRPEGYGSSVNGGELLFLSLATCFCNDIYREAAKRKMNVQQVEVRVSGEFGKEGEPASNITYAVSIQSSHSKREIDDLVQYVDKIAEVHNTLRKGVDVLLMG